MYGLLERDLQWIEKAIARRIINRISDDLNEEYPLPCFFDVVHYESISNEELKRHIDTVGKIIKSR
jgi:hypothetical protein